MFTTLAHRTLTALVAVAVAAAGLLVGAPPADAAEVITHDAPDPHIMADGGAYWAYTTNINYYFHTTNVPVYRSSDMRNWTLVADALPALGAWAAPGNTWAPGTTKLTNGQYALYYTARHRASGFQCIGVAISNRPSGPFVDHNGAPIVCQVERGGSIDAYPIHHGGHLYLLWKSDDNAIGHQTHLWSARLSADGRRLTTGHHHLLAGDKGWEQPLIENPAMISNQAGQFTLFYSANWWESKNYAVGYATCISPLGPCAKHTNNGPFMSSFSGAAGPGGQAVFTDLAGRTQMVYHAWHNDHVGYAWGGVRSMHIDQIHFSNGHPSLRNAAANAGFNPVVGVAEANGGGFWVSSADGAVVAHDGATHRGDMNGIALAKPVISMASTPTGNGYWLVAADGGIFTFGDARFYGSTGAMHLNRPIVGMASTPSGNGYWMVASDGGIFSFGDAKFYGSTGAMHLNRPIVGMASTPSGNGYWLVASDGGIFSFGDAKFYGSTGGIRLNQPIVGMAATSNGRGYWLIAGDGGVFTFGNAGYHGSLPGRGLALEASGVVRNASGGYTVVASNGNVQRFN